MWRQIKSVPLLSSEVSNNTRSPSPFSGLEAQFLVVQGRLAPLRRDAAAWERAGAGAAAQGGGIKVL